MTQMQVKKVVAVCFLEAVKLTLEQLGERRLVLSQDGHSAPPELPRLYGDVRRLRDYLQRCVSSYRDAVDLKLDESGASLLVASCRRSVEAIEFRLQERAISGDERQWLRQKIQVLSDWAVEIAAKPIVELPLARIGTMVGEFSRGLTTRIQGRVWGDVSKRKKIVPPKSKPSGTSQGISSFGDHFSDVDAEGEEDGGGVDNAAPAAQAAPQAGPAGRPAAKPAAAPATTSAVGALMFDSQSIHDPRLRALVAIDLASFERSRSAGDYRMALVLLGSIMESVVLDHAIPRRHELGLADGPEKWQMSDVLNRAMGDQAGPKDATLCYHLFAGRNLLRPSLQIVAPVVVTATSFEHLRDFARRALSALGYGAQAAADDTPLVLGQSWQPLDSED